MTSPFPLTPSTQSELLTLHNLLHLLYHRNKNQHRRSIWWRSFSTFKRELDKLLSELGIEDSIPDNRVMPPRTLTAEKKKRKLEKQAALNFEAKVKERQKKEEGLKRADVRVRVWTEELVEGWYRAFAQLIASNRFAQLGLVLLAALARVCHLLGITEIYEAQAEEELHTLLNEFAQKDAMEIFGAASESPFAGTPLGEDLGERVERTVDAEGGPNGLEVPAADDAGSKGVDSVMKRNVMRVEEKVKGPAVERPVQKPAKKKKKRGNAIDDIFGGF